MKIFLLILLICTSSVFSQINTAKLLTPADSVYEVYGNKQWLEIAVYDASNPDSITVWYPYTTISGSTYYAAVGSIKEVATDDIITGLYGSADMKYYILWLPNPRAVRFLLSDYASGNVEIKASDKP